MNRINDEMNNSNEEKRNALLILLYLQFRFCHECLYEGGLGLTNSDDCFDGPGPDLVLNTDGAGRLGDRCVALVQPFPLAQADSSGKRSD